MQARSGTSLSGSGYFSVQPVVGQGCGPSVSMSASVPSGLTDYRTPGRWASQLSCTESGWYLTRTYAARRSYADTFDSAVRGPADQFPAINGGYLSYLPGDLFNDPALAGFECCAKAAVTLRRGGKVLKRDTLDQSRSQRSFSSYLHATGWYTLNVNTSRWNPQTPVPPGILSPRSTITGASTSDPVLSAATGPTFR
jgi:hypothetical protein